MLGIAVKLKCKYVCEVVVKPIDKSVAQVAAIVAFVQLGAMILIPAPYLIEREFSAVAVVVVGGAAFFGMLKFMAHYSYDDTVNLWAVAAMVVTALMRFFQDFGDGDNLIAKALFNFPAATLVLIWQALNWREVVEPVFDAVQIMPEAEAVMAIRKKLVECDAKWTMAGMSDQEKLAKLKDMLARWRGHMAAQGFDPVEIEAGRTVIEDKIRSLSRLSDLGHGAS